MGRTIPSFRQLLEIEKLDWSDFQKKLPTKKDKKTFDAVFESAKLYTSYLSNAVNPVVLESAMMGALFHNYKTLLEASKEKDEVNENSITNDTKLLTDNKPQGRKLFDRTCKKWRGLIEALHMEDRQILLEMILETCNYDECCGMVTNSGDSESPIDYFFFLTVLLQQQKLYQLVKVC